MKNQYRNKSKVYFSPCKRIELYLEVGLTTETVIMYQILVLLFAP